MNKTKAVIKELIHRTKTGDIHWEVHECNGQTNYFVQFDNNSYVRLERAWVGLHFESTFSKYLLYIDDLMISASWCRLNPLYTAILRADKNKDDSIIVRFMNNVFGKSI